MKTQQKILAYALLVAIGLVSLINSTSASEIRQQVLADKLIIPWGMTLIDEHQLLVGQRDGNVYLVRLETGQKTKISGLPDVLVHGQGGLLDIQRAPNYRANQWIYFTYVKPVDGKGATTLARAKLKGSTLSEWQDLLVTNSRTKTGRHFGSRIAFDQRGHVFFSVGDRGVRSTGQDLTTHAGKILRVTLDGSVPTDNPFVSQAGVLPEIYSYGHRNPQGLAYDDKSQRLWAIEHGPRGGDEINLIKPGANYGWAVTSHGKEYWGPIAVGESKTKAGVEPPKKVYIPSIAPSSLVIYQGQEFKHWQGDLLAGALKLMHINHVALNGEKIAQETRLLENNKQRIRNLIVDGKGRLLVATDDGKIIRLTAK